MENIINLYRDNNGQKEQALLLLYYFYIWSIRNIPLKSYRNLVEVIEISSSTAFGQSPFLTLRR